MIAAADTTAPLDPAIIVVDEAVPAVAAAALIAVAAAAPVVIAATAVTAAAAVAPQELPIYDIVTIIKQSRYKYTYETHNTTSYLSLCTLRSFMMSSSPVFLDRFSSSTLLCCNLPALEALVSFRGGDGSSTNSKE